MICGKHDRLDEIKGGAVGTVITIGLGIFGINHHNNKKG
jgi:hypothetical protein